MVVLYGSKRFLIIRCSPGLVERVDVFVGRWGCPVEGGSVLFDRSDFVRLALEEKLVRDEAVYLERLRLDSERGSPLSLISLSQRTDDFFLRDKLSRELKKVDSEESSEKEVYMQDVGVRENGEPRASE